LRSAGTWASHSARSVAVWNGAHPETSDELVVAEERHPAKEPTGIVARDSRSEGLVETLAGRVSS